MRSIFGGELLGDGLVGEWSAKVAGDFWIAPKLAGEREVGGGPAAKAEAARGEEVGVASRSRHSKKIVTGAK